MFRLQLMLGFKKFKHNALLMCYNKELIEKCMAYYAFNLKHKSYLGFNCFVRQSKILSVKVLHINETRNKYAIKAVVQHIKKIYVVMKDAVVKADKYYLKYVLKHPFTNWKKYSEKKHSQHSIDHKVLNYFKAKQQKFIYEQWKIRYTHKHKSSSIYHYLLNKYSIQKYYNTWRTKFHDIQMFNHNQNTNEQKLMIYRKANIFKTIVNYSSNRINCRKYNDAAIQERKWWLCKTAFKKWRNYIPKLVSTHQLASQINHLRVHSNKTRIVKGLKQYHQYCALKREMNGKSNSIRKRKAIKKYTTLWRNQYNKMSSIRMTEAIIYNHRYKKCYDRLKFMIPYMKTLEKKAEKKSRFTTLAKSLHKVHKYANYKVVTRNKGTEYSKKISHNTLMQAMQIWKHEFEHSNRIYMMFAFIMIQFKNIITKRFYQKWSQYHQDCSKNKIAHQHYRKHSFQYAISTIRDYTQITQHSRKISQLISSKHKSNITNLATHYWKTKAIEKHTHSSILMQINKIKSTRYSKLIIKCLKEYAKSSIEIREASQQLKEVKDRKSILKHMSLWKKLATRRINRQRKLKQLIFQHKSNKLKLAFSLFAQGVKNKLATITTVDQFKKDHLPHKLIYNAFKFIRTYLSKIIATRNASNFLSLKAINNAKKYAFSSWKSVFSDRITEEHNGFFIASKSYVENLKVKSFCSLSYYHNKKHKKTLLFKKAIAQYEVHLLFTAYKSWLVASNNHKTEKQIKEQKRQEEKSTLAECLRIKSLEAKSIKAFAEYVNKKHSMRGLSSLREKLEGVRIQAVMKMVLSTWKSRYDYALKMKVISDNIKQNTTLIQKQAYFNKFRNLANYKKQMQNKICQMQTLRKKECFEYIINLVIRKQQINSIASQLYIKTNSMLLHRYMREWIRKKYKADSIKASSSIYQKLLKSKAIKALTQNMLAKQANMEKTEKAMLLHCFHINKIAIDSLKLYTTHRQNIHGLYHIAEQCSQSRIIKQIKDVFAQMKRKLETAQNVSLLHNKSNEIYRKLKIKSFLKTLAQRVIIAISNKKQEERAIAHYGKNINVKCIHKWQLYYNKQKQKEAFTDMVSTFSQSRNANAIRDTIHYLNCYSAISININASTESAAYKIQLIQKRNAFGKFLIAVKDDIYMKTMSLKLLQCHGQRCSEKILFKMFQSWKQYTAMKKEKIEIMKSKESLADNHLSVQSKRKILNEWHKSTNDIIEKMRRERMKKMFTSWIQYAKEKKNLLKYLKEGKMDTAIGIITPKLIKGNDSPN